VGTIRAAETITIAAPPEQVYAWWEAFDQYEEFMLGVHKVEPLPDDAMRWSTEVGEHDMEWEADVIDRVPGRRLAWVSRTGPQQDAMVELEPVEGGTFVRWTVEMDPGELAGDDDPARFLSIRMQGDLERLRDLLEGRRGTGPGASAERTIGVVQAPAPAARLNEEGELVAPAPSDPGGTPDPVVVRQLDRPEIQPEWAAEPGDPVDPDEVQAGATQDESATS
jgi:uncharacterized protein YndB with AHSA1/START domain